MTRAGEQHKPFFTQAELKKAIELRSSGIRLKDIAERFGRTPNCMGAKMSQYKRTNGPQFVREAQEARARRIIALYSKGVTLRELCRIYNRSSATISLLMNYRGYDASWREEVRQRLRKEEPDGRTND